MTTLRLIVSVRILNFGFPSNFWFRISGFGKPQPCAFV